MNLSCAIEAFHSSKQSWDVFHSACRPDNWGRGSNNLEFGRNWIKAHMQVSLCTGSAGATGKQRNV